MLQRSILLVLILLGFTTCQDSNSNPTIQNDNKTKPIDKPLTNQKKIPRIVFFGNSLTAGYGINIDKAFPALIQNRITESGFEYHVVNAGLSGETTAGGNSRVNWILRQSVNIFVLELGGNDGLRGIPVDNSKSNLQSIIDKVRTKYPKAKVVLAGMEAPPNMGEQFTKGFRDMYTDLAKKNGLPLIPFLLEGVAGNPSLNLPDGIHPTIAGHKIVAENIWKVLLPLL